MHNILCRHGAILYSVPLVVDPYDIDLVFEGTPNDYTHVSLALLSLSSPVCIICLTKILCITLAEGRTSLQSLAASH